MEINITFPDDIGIQINNLPNPSEFVSHAVEVALAKLTKSKPSKWAQIAQRIHNDPVHLLGYSKQLKQDMKEFRENFEFLHDR